MSNKPPAAIASARPILWARTGPPVRFTGKLNHYVDGERLGHVEILVIAQYGKDDEVLILHCDQSWHSVAASAHGSIQEAKDRAEAWYEGISARWEETGYSVQDTESYLDELFSGNVCTFCAKRPDQAEYIYGSGKGYICGECLEIFHKQLVKQKARAE